MPQRVFGLRGGPSTVLIAGGLLSCLLLLLACTTGARTDKGGAFQKVTPATRVYSHEDFDAIGFKTRKQYNVEGLPEAVGAWYGFWQTEAAVPLEYEVRAYRSHEDAVEYGTALAEEGAGPDAVLTSNKATWVEGVRERRSTGGPGGGAAQGGPGARSGHAPRYGDFAIFANLILLCEGSDSDQSLERCASLARALEQVDGR